MKYKCNVCNTYIYDSDIGDSKTNLAQGLKPEDFPDDWRCPICQADKTHQMPIDEAGNFILKDAGPNIASKHAKTEPSIKKEYEGNAEIEPKENSHYAVGNLSDFKNADNENIETSKEMILCRCGHSKNKPFCDFTHTKFAFTTDKHKDRVPDKMDDYAGKEITIHDNRGVCSHAGYCTDNLPNVFRMGKEPWIDPDGASADEIARVIRMCPSGALSFTRDGVLYKDLDNKPSVKVRADGPYEIKGGIKLNDKNNKPESKEHYALCRCGSSKNKPFCDGSHWYVDFKDNGKPKEQAPKEQEPEEQKQDINYYRDESRKKLTGICSANKVCDGNPDRLCMGQKYGKPIGFGGAGQGKTFSANFKALEKYRFKMKVVKPHAEPDMKTEIFGVNIPMPVMTASISGIEISANGSMSEPDFQRGMIEGAKLFGSIGLSGNTVDYPEHPGVEIIKENGGHGIPVFKPQAQDKLIELFKRAEDADAIAIGVDLDGCGSTNWAYRGKPVYRKGADDLKELVGSTKKPVFFKGIMNIEDARAVVDSGAAGLVVSNHGGRVLDYGQGVAEVLPEIAKEFKGKITIIADGAVRTGYDVLKLLALGADIALIGRPLARMVLGGGAEAVVKYLKYVQGDLRGAMLMTGCDSLDEINDKILVV